MLEYSLEGEPAGIAVPGAAVRADQRRMMRLYLAGHTAREIAERLERSPAEVRRGLLAAVACALQGSAGEVKRLGTAAQTRRNVEWGALHPT